MANVTILILLLTTLEDRNTVSIAFCILLGLSWAAARLTAIFYIHLKKIIASELRKKRYFTVFSFYFQMGLL